MSKKPSSQSFWVDEPDFQPKQFPFTGFTRFTYNMLRIIGFTFFLFLQFAPILAWAWLLVFLAMIGFLIYPSKRRKSSIADSTLIQNKARELSGAFLIGSAIHVAGHPSLERDQNVVLALTTDSLKIFNYVDPTPIVTIPLDQLVGVHTVVYDDDRTPHIDTIDSAAQALQITMSYQGREFPCLFRKMRKLRPIDWYHELQKALWQSVL